jgi:hypothetical protein
MKLKELKSILYSTHGYVQFAIVYDIEKNTDIENGCSIEYAIKNHGEKEVKHIQAFEHQLVISV